MTVHPPHPPSGPARRRRAHADAAKMAEAETLFAHDVAVSRAEPMRPE